MKFWVRAGGVDVVRHKIQRHLPVYRFEDGPAISRISSTYLDTTAFALYRERVLKPDADHVLLRVRWYNRIGSGPVFVEMKTNGQPGEPSLKRRLPVRHDAVHDFVRGAADPDVLATGDASQARRARLHSLFTELRAFVASHQLQPTVHVQYFRQAFQRSADESSVRITLDTRLSMRAARGRDPLGGFSGPAPASPAAVGQRSSWVVSKRRSRALSSRPCWASAPRFWS